MQDVLIRDDSDQIPAGRESTALEIDNTGIARIPANATETTIYTNNPNAQGSNSPVHQVLYLSLHLFNLVCLKLGMGVLLLVVSRLSESNLWWTFPALYLFYLTFKELNCLVFRATRLAQFPDIAADLSFDLTHALGMGTIALGVLCYFFKLVPSFAIVYFALPHVLLSIVSFFRFRRERTMMFSFPFWTLLESLQLALLMWKLSYPDKWTFTWETTSLLLLYTWNIFEMVGIVFCIFAAVVLGTLIYRFTQMDMNGRFELFAGFFCLVMLGGDLIIGKRFFQLVIRGLESGAISPIGQSPVIHLGGVWGLGLAMVIFYGVAFVAVLGVVSLIAGGGLGLTQQNVRKISLLSFPELINSGYNQVSDVFFQPRNRADPQGEVQPPENCSICVASVSDVILQPCGHGGYCQTCITDWVKNKPECPLCKTNVKQMLVVQFDVEKRRLMTTGIIKLN